jgi:1-phosphofructokinase family hexose kinase
VILTVTLNAALDRTLRVPNFQLNLRHRASSSLALPGGKGVNVARALKRLGQPVIATGLAGGRTGTTIIEQLTAEGILNDFVRIHEESRTSTAVIDPTNSLQTEINEAGPSVTEAELSVLLDKLQYLCKGADVVVLAGSLPPDVPADFYATLIRQLRRHSLVSALDVAGPPLRAGISAEPSLVSPNTREAEEIVGHEFQDEADLVAAAETLMAMGAESAILHEESGCVARLRDGKRVRSFRARVPRLEVVSTVGSGDAFLAGYLAARYEGRAPDQCLRFGVACGAESTGRLGAGLIDPREARRLMGDVELSVVELAAEITETA